MSPASAPLHAVGTAVAPGPSARFESLDAARGLAALWVTVFHCTNVLVQPATSLVGDACLAGWAGVDVFFPISGYCILAAVESPRNPTLARFLGRRWRRIFPPYWASVALAIGVALVALRWNSGSLSQFPRAPWEWLSIATLTQQLTQVPHAVNPVYWSLCYEEQFYLVIAATMLLSPRARRGALLALSVGSALYRLAPEGVRVPGLFLDRWLEFAVGMALYDFAGGAARRAWAGSLVLVAAVTIGLTRDVDLAIALGAALVLVALRPIDARLARARLGAALGALGAMSYSLYLVHVPIGGRVVNLLHRVLAAPAWTPLVAGLAVAASVAVAMVFHRLVERRFASGGARAPAP